MTATWSSKSRQQLLTLSFAKIQNRFEIDLFKSVDDFETAKAPNFNKSQPSSTRRPQSIQQEPVRINKNP
jgi:hypothetical protein